MTVNDEALSEQRRCIVVMWVGSFGWLMQWRLHARSTNYKLKVQNLFSLLEYKATLHTVKVSSFFFPISSNINSRRNGVRMYPSCDVMFISALLNFFVLYVKRSFAQVLQWRPLWTLPRGGHHLVHPPVAHLSIGVRRKPVNFFPQICSRCFVHTFGHLIFLREFSFFKQVEPFMMPEGVISN